MPGSQLDEHAIFAVAIKIPDPEARATYLSQVCENDASIFDRVSALVATHEGDSRFLQDPPPGVNPTIDLGNARDLCGTRIGRYKLLQEIGEGGFGTVYMAEQTEPMRRKVAIKVVKPGMDSREVLARFEAERQALALMDHPNIARVLDAGTTESGHPYFVMELVKGVNITHFADDNNLSTRARMKLLAKVCRAVQHAHQKGIIHDIKPSNVLVTLHDGEPVPKIIDFGVSKALSQQLTEKTLFTRYGQVIGTPQYMSPEQAELSGLDVDTRSDIYALGVLVYELLVGQPPFDPTRLKQAGLDEMRRLIREEDPCVPSQLIRTLDVNTATTVATHRSCQREVLCRELSGELDWITMKALAKDRNQRYATALEFSDDIERFLNGEAVEAGPPTLAYRFSKSWRRHRAPILTGGIVATALFIGCIIAFAGWANSGRLLAAAQQAEQEARESEEETQRANQQLEQANTEARAATQEAVTARQNIRETLELVLELLAQSGTNPETNRQFTIKEALIQLADRVQAGVELQPETEAELMLGLGDAFMLSGDRDQALQHFRNALEIAVTVWPPNHPRHSEARRKTAYLARSITDLRQAVAIDRDSSNTIERVKSLALVGDLAASLGEREIAVQALREAVKEFPVDQLDSFEFTELPHLTLVALLEPETDEIDRQSIKEIGVQLARERFGDNEASWFERAIVMHTCELPAAADRAFEIGLTCEQTVSAMWLRSTGLGYSNEGLRRKANAAFEFAARYARLKDHSGEYGWSQVNRGRIRYEAGEYAQGAPLTAEAVEWVQPNLDGQAAFLTYEYVQILRQLGHHELARPHCEYLINLANQTTDSTTGYLSDLHWLLAVSLLCRMHVGQVDDLSQPLADFLDNDAVPAIYKGTVLAEMILSGKTDFGTLSDGGIQMLLETSISSKTAGVGCVGAISVRDAYIDWMQKRDRLPEAIAFLSMTTWVQYDLQLHPSSIQRAWVRLSLARACRINGDYESARDRLAQALAIFERHPYTPQEQLSDIRDQIAECDRQLAQAESSDKTNDRD